MMMMSIIVALDDSLAFKYMIAVKFALLLSKLLYCCQKIFIVVKNAVLMSKFRFQQVLTCVAPKA